jgi:chemosensory pili system protein ChpA (sensor histidine kinase/response regulator)
MLIEDDANVFSLLHMLLEFEGYQVVHWEGGEQVEEVLGLIRRERPSLVLLDVNLRHLSGFEVLRALRRDPGLKGTRVLMTSGMDLTYRSRQEGADGFITKPFMPDDLIQTIQETLG